MKVTLYEKEYMVAPLRKSVLRVFRQLEIDLLYALALSLLENPPIRK